MNAYKNFDLRNILLLHVFICILGMLQLIAKISLIVGDSIFVPYNTVINYNYWAELSSPSLGKPAHLIQYIISVIFIFGCYGYYTILRDRLNILEGTELLKKIITNKFILPSYFLAIIIINILIFNDKSYQLLWVASLVILWLIIFIIPAIPLLNYTLGNLRYKNFANSSGYIVLLTLTGWMFWIFAPYIYGNMPIRNDFMDISSQTIIDGEYVDNTSYINKFRLGGLYKYDPRTDLGLTPTHNLSDSIKIQNSSSLRNFLSKNGNKSKYYYDENRSLLFVKGTMTKEDLDFFIGISKDKIDENEIYNFHNKEDKKIKYTKENIDFIKKNTQELINQATAGHFFHHHNAMYSPINEYALGKPFSEINFFYGWFNSLIIMTFSKLLGGVSFDNYIQVTYSFYPLYYLFVIGVASLVFKRLNYVLIVAIISVVFTNILGFEHIRFGPGLNPIRHFIDVFTLLFFYFYLFSEHRKQLFLTLALAFSLLGVLINRELGIVLFLSFAVSILIFIIRRSINKYRDFSLLILSFISLFGLILSVISGYSENKTLIYSLLGVSVPETPSTMLFMMLLLFSGIYVLLEYNKRDIDYRWRYLLFFWFAYSQGLLIYYIWNPAPNHLTCLGSVWAILFVLILKYILLRVSQDIENKLVLIPLSISFLLFLPTSFIYTIHQKSYLQEFKDHMVYQWNFPSAQIATTMDPIYFENSIMLINKYEKKNGIYIISKYDNVLPFLSQKYSKMPFVEVGLSLVTDKEMKQSIDVFVNNSPEFIFVDTDIKRSYLGDVYDPNDKITKLLGTYDLSSGRVEVLSNFQRIFFAIEDKYKLIERGTLISVYQKK